MVSQSHKHFLILRSVLFAVCYSMCVIKLRPHSLPLLFILDRRKILLCFASVLSQSLMSLTALGKALVKDTWSYDKSRGHSPTSQTNCLNPHCQWEQRLHFRSPFIHVSFANIHEVNMLPLNAQSDFHYIFFKCQMYQERVILFFKFQHF